MPNTELFGVPPLAMGKNTRCSCACWAGVGWGKQRAKRAKRAKRVERTMG
jgi:hypothetical protein